MSLVFVINRPAALCTGNHVYIGPTKVEYYLVDEQKRQTEIQRREAKLFKFWRAEDFAATQNGQLPRPEPTRLTPP